MVFLPPILCRPLTPIPILTLILQLLVRLIRSRDPIGPQRMAIQFPNRLIRSRPLRNSRLSHPSGHLPQNNHLPAQTGIRIHPHQSRPTLLPVLSHRSPIKTPTLQKSQRQLIQRSN